jgi:hypothetical protein
MNTNSISANAANVFTVIIAVAFLGVTTLGIAQPVHAKTVTTSVTR